MAKKKQDNDRRISGISINAKGKVSIAFSEVITLPPVEGEDENETSANEYTVRSPNRPHKDFLDAMKKLRKDALAIGELNFDAKSITSMTVSDIKISGDMVMKQSRVQMTLAKEVKRTGKRIKIGPLPQVTMYGTKEESDYDNTEAMTQLIEAVVKEAWAYLEEGKCDGEEQLPLFPTIQLQTA